MINRSDLNGHINLRIDKYIWEENSWTEMKKEERRKKREYSGIESDGWFRMLKVASGA
jgi:phage terminase large subunit-like protein